MKVWNIASIAVPLMLNTGGVTIAPGESVEVSESEAKQLVEGFPVLFSLNPVSTPAAAALKEGS